VWGEGEGDAVLAKPGDARRARDGGDVLRARSSRLGPRRHLLPRGWRGRHGQSTALERAHARSPADSPCERRGGLVATESAHASKAPPVLPLSSRSEAATPLSLSKRGFHLTLSFLQRRC
jgi:hypothetical protein